MHGVLFHTTPLSDPPLQVVPEELFRCELYSNLPIHLQIIKYQTLSSLL